MPLSDEARQELEKWFETAELRLRVRHDERRATRTTRNVAVVGVILTVLGVLGADLHQILPQKRAGFPSQKFANHSIAAAVNALRARFDYVLLTGGKGNWERAD